MWYDDNKKAKDEERSLSFQNEAICRINQERIAGAVKKKRRSMLA